MEGTPRKLRRSRRDRIVAGVCGGIGEYFNIDPVIIRLLFLLLILQVGSGLFIYFILAIIIPAASGKDEENIPSRGEKIREFAQGVGARVHNFARDVRDNKSWFSDRRNAVGSVFLLIGLSILFSQMFPDYWRWWATLWPALLVLVGVYIILKR
ncbi:MAG: PspC domain-containing protein [bacterium]